MKGVAERVDDQERAAAPFDDITPLMRAARVACSWLADRYPDRAALASDVEEIIAAYVAAIQVWQDYEETEPRGPRRGKGVSIADWIGPRRTGALRTINARIDHLVEDAVRLAGLPAPASGDHVLLDSMRDLVDPKAEDPAGFAARAVIRRLNEKNVRLREVAQGLTAV